MIKLIKKIKNGLVPYEAKGFRSGFVILFAITLASIILAVSLSVANIAYNETRFSTSTRDANDAFFAADNGSEAVLFKDKGSGDGTICTPNSGGSCTTSFIMYNLGGRSASCALITITKDNTAPPAIKTTIISKGYNVGDSNCVSSNTNRLERELDTFY